MSNQTLQFYKKNNKKLYEQYSSVSFESIHKDWLSFLPNTGELTLDIGAGSGRDTIWLSNQGYQVIAVEPVTEFFDQFKKNKQLAHQNNKIEWIVDSLPELSKLKQFHNQIGLILLSAVWMHLTTEERNKSFHSFTQLNKQDGLLVISLRYGKSPDERLMYPVCIKEVESLANEYHYKIESIKKSNDQLSRNDVYWETIILRKVS